MRVIICGAGRVGYGLASRLSQERNTVTVIDTSPDLIRQITNELDVRGVIGHGSHPDVLVKAGVDDCDMIIAVTHADEVNMMACQVAHSLFNVPTKVARVRAQGYLDGDRAYIITQAAHSTRLLEVIGAHQTQARHVVIIGGGNIGTYVAEKLEGKSGMRVRVIENNKERAEKVAEQLNRTVILNGDAMDAEIQEEAGVANAEMVISLTNSDSVNILSAVLARKLGARTTISLINELSMQEMQSELGINMIIDPRASTISSILRHVMRDVMLSEGVAIGAIITDGDVIPPTDEFVLRPGHRVVLMAEKGALESVMTMFRVSSDYY